MGRMLVPPSGNALYMYQSDVAQGTWKFRPEGSAQVGISFDDLTTALHELLSLNPGGGEFLLLTIYEAASNEFGAFMVYHMSKAEAQHAINREAEDHWLDKYIDFFMRRTGLAFKGHEGFRSHVVNMRLPENPAEQAA